jgi:hypothetical protein
MDDNAFEADDHIDYETLITRYRILEEAFAEQTGMLIEEVHDRIRQEEWGSLQEYAKQIYHPLMDEQTKRLNTLTDVIRRFSDGPDLENYQKWYLCRALEFFVDVLTARSRLDDEKLVHEFLEYYPLFRKAGYLTDFIREALEANGFYVSDEELEEIPEVPEEL